MFVLSIWAVCLMIGFSIAAAILKLSCALVGANVPDTGLAIVTSVLESVVGGVIRFTVVLGAGYLGTKLHFEKPDLVMMVSIALVAIAIIVPAGIYMPMLRVSFGQGLIITLLRYVITIAAIVAVGFVLMSISGKNTFALSKIF
jgi:hypothetical protein